MLANVLTNEIFDILSKFATHFAKYLQALVTDSERSQVILRMLTNIDQFGKRLLNFSGCCECRHSLSIFVKIRKPLVTFVRHSEAFATFVRHLQGVCNVRRFSFLAHVLSPLTMIEIQKKTMSPASYSLRLYINHSLVIKYSHHL